MTLVAKVSAPKVSIIRVSIIKMSITRISISEVSITKISAPIVSISIVSISIVFIIVDSNKEGFVKGIFYFFFLNETSLFSIYFIRAYIRVYI